MLAKIENADFKIGMFVAELDRPWEESPFLLQGFRLSTPEEVEQLRACCEYVYIDPRRSDLDVRPAGRQAVGYKAATEVVKSQVVSKSADSVNLSSSRPRPDAGAPDREPDLDVQHAFSRDNLPAGHEHVRQVRAAREAHQILELPGEFVDYKVTSPVEQEYQTAREIREELGDVLEETFERYRNSENLSLAAVKKSTQSLVGSMVRNPDAAQLLCQLREKDSLSYAHSISASILAILFGRHLGLNEKELNTLAMGALLLDVGKMKLPLALLSKKGKILPPEAKLLRKHVEYSVNLLAHAEDVDIEVLSIVESHHERYDGSGYPKGLKGAEIPVFGRIAAIIDFYDAITHERPYRRSVSPCYAVNALYERQGTHFQQELVEEFIQCLGVYPTGSLVLLSSGEVGIVIEQNELRRLRPKVLIVRDSKKKDLEEPFTRDLEYEKTDEKGERLFILTALEPGAYGISDEDYYL
ncbi:MAG TPA: HD-GYP domain-containing protein [Gammaproteobacteria bacterium]|nr:HD-GYP domain-containing protein [Gammaproteobacteria bacterium]